MFCVPLGRVLVARVAMPELLMLTVPSAAVPSMKVTVPPEGTPTAEFTKAERATCWPKADGLGVPETEVVVVVSATSRAGAKLLEIEPVAPESIPLTIAAVVGTTRDSSDSKVRQLPCGRGPPCPPRLGRVCECFRSWRFQGERKLMDQTFRSNFLGAETRLGLKENRRAKDPWLIVPLSKASSIDDCAVKGN
jgi:hypothetical protein